MLSNISRNSSVKTVFYVSRDVSIKSSKITAVASRDLWVKDFVNPIERSLENLKSINVSRFILKGMLGIFAQAVFYKAAQEIVPDRDIIVVFCKLKIATLVAILATAILFGIASFFGGVGFFPVIRSTCNNIAIDILRSHYGLTMEALLRSVRKGLV